MATPSTRSFRLTGADGGPLRGDVRSAAGARPAVVMCHGFKGFKDWGFFPRIADRLARAGFTAVSFNFSGSGVGEDGEHSTLGVGHPWAGPTPVYEQVEQATVAWLARHLA